VIDARKVAIQGVGAAPLMMAVQGLLVLLTPPPPPPSEPGRGLVYSPSRSPMRSPIRHVVRW
jgi:DNA-binding transcriptional LysR family regulator